MFMSVVHKIDPSPNPKMGRPGVIRFAFPSSSIFLEPFRPNVLDTVFTAVILISSRLLRDHPPSRDIFSSERHRRHCLHCQHHGRPRTVFTANVMGARGITSILGIIHVHDTIDVSHPCGTDDILTRPTSSRSSPSAPGPCRPGPHPRQPRHHRHVYGWGPQDAGVSLAMRTVGRQPTPKWGKNKANVAVSDRSARWSLTTTPLRVLCANFLKKIRAQKEAWLSSSAVASQQDTVSC